MASQVNSSAPKPAKGRPRSFDHDQALQKALRLFWEKGYETTSVAELCLAMGINPPSLYSCFGSKSALFIEAVLYYERTYWQAPSERFIKNPDIYDAVSNFFAEAASILCSKETPCGCMVVLAAVNVGKDARDVVQTVQKLRRQTCEMFRLRLEEAVKSCELPINTDV
ncbi:MAG: TetR/AcrR family transcriptional regulator, partial [Desulfovibrio sp.]|nr:TetR/AcrR family transcriptional regulator [Desulfovibrio sp.]